MDHYTVREKIALGFLLAASIGSLFFYLSYHTAAFPEHTIELAVTREQAAVKAADFLRDQGVSPENFTAATIFSTEGYAKTYLEREVGVERTAELARQEIDLWHFSSRFFKPLQQEEFTVSFLPSGRLAGYDHEVEEAKAGAFLSQDQARQRATLFLANTAAVDLSKWTLVASDEIKRPARIDHLFTWEHHSLNLGQATYRMSVLVQGDEIGQYYEFVKIPEEWERAYEKERSRNNLAQMVAEIITYLLFGISLSAVFIRHYRRGTLRLKFAWRVGLVAGLVSLLTDINSLPLEFYYYSTLQSWEAFLGMLIVDIALGGLVVAIFVGIIIATAEAMYRQTFPHSLSIEASLTKALWSKSVNKAIFIGTFGTIISFAYGLAYYFLGTKVGFWTPAQINYDDVFSTLLPWVYPLFYGLLPALMEEGMFRLFGISLLKKYLKHRWLAVLITAVAWAFLHSSYPQTPWFARGIELTIVGVVFGWLFVRYGILASIVAHYSFNALGTAIFLYASGSLYTGLSSTLVGFLPLLVALAGLGKAWYQKGFLKISSHLTNDYLEKAVAKEVKPEKPQPTPLIGQAYAPLRSSLRATLIGLAVCSLGVLWIVQPLASYDLTPLTIDRQDALRIAKQELSSRDIPVEEFRTTLAFESRGGFLGEDYLLEHGTFENLTVFYRDFIPPDYWSVWFFKPLDPQSYTVDIFPDGRVFRVVYSLSEDAAGAQLNRQAAEAIGREYLITRGFPLDQYQVASYSSKKQTNRVDHTFVFEKTSPFVGEAKFRVEFDVLGDQPSNLLQSLKIPESWEREQQTMQSSDFVLQGIQIAVSLLLLVLGVQTFLQFIRQRQLQFRKVFLPAGVIAGFMVVDGINSLPSFYYNYITSIPLSTHIVESLLVSVFAVAGFFFLGVVVLSFFTALWKLYVGDIFPREGIYNKAYITDALIIAYSLPLIGLAISQSFLLLAISQDWLFTPPPFPILIGLDTFVPALAIITALPLELLIAMAGASVLLIVRNYLGTWQWTIAAVLAASILFSLSAHYALDQMALSIAENLLSLVSFFLAIFLIVRRNLLAYGGILYVSTTFLSVAPYISSDAPSLQLSGIALALAACLPLFAYGYLFIVKRGQE